MEKNIERTKNGIDTLIDRTRDVVIGAADRAESGVVAVADGAAVKMTEGAYGAGDFVRESAESTARGAHRRLDGAATMIDRGFTRARSDISNAAADATDFFTENPGKSLLLATSAGFVLGMLVRGRRCAA